MSLHIIIYSQQSVLIAKCPNVTATICWCKLTSSGLAISLNLSTLSRYSLELVSASSAVFLVISVEYCLWAVHRASLLVEKSRLCKLGVSRLTSCWQCPSNIAAPEMWCIEEIYVGLEQCSFFDALNRLYVDITFLIDATNIWEIAHRYESLSVIKYLTSLYVKSRTISYVLVWQSIQWRAWNEAHIGPVGFDLDMTWSTCLHL